MLYSYDMLRAPELSTVLGKLTFLSETEGQLLVPAMIRMSVCVCVCVCVTTHPLPQR